MDTIPDVQCAFSQEPTPSDHATCTCRKQGGADVVAVVITLRWSATSMNQAFPAEGGSFLDSLRQQAAPDPRTPSGRAKLRWREVRMLFIEFKRARR